MAVTLLARNLRDGQLVIADGASATLTLALDNGDLSWTETLNPIEILDRGVLDHVRDGDQAPVELSFSSMWTNLVNASLSAASGGDANTVYEMLNNIGETYTSVGATGEKFQLQFTFTVTDPAGNNSEQIVFAKVYATSIECSEGDDSNTLNVSARDFETRPTITPV